MNPVPPPPPSINTTMSDGRSSILNATVAYPSYLPPTDRLWSFVDDATGIDWYAPMLAIQQLSKLPFASLAIPPPPPLVFPPGELTLSKILPDEQIFSLLNLFDERYTPWLNFKPARNTNSAVLDMVCCAVAARHLDNSPASIQAKMLLQKLTDDSIAKIIMNPRPHESVESIQALLILSLWAPLGGPVDNEGRDGRLLVASAVSMAMNLRLNQASLKASSLRKRILNPDEQRKLVEAVDNARLWIALTNTESMLCLGTGRIPLSRRSPEDLHEVQFPKAFHHDTNYNDLRLGLVASAFDLLEDGANNRLQAGMDVDEWYDQITVILEKMKRVKRLMGPLPFVLEREQFYFHMLNIYEAMCRLLILYHAMWDARGSVGSVPPGESWHQFFKPHGMEAVGEWGREMAISTEALLTYVLAADSRLLSTAPDNIFTMVALTSGYLIGVKFLMFRGGTDLLGSSDLLLSKVVSQLGSAVCGPGHAAQRTALLVRGMIAKWEARHRPPPQRPTPNRSPSSQPFPSSSLPLPSPSSYPTPNSDGSMVQKTPNSEFLELSAFTEPLNQMSPLPDIDFSLFMDSMSMDPEFWGNLAQQAHLLPGHE
ncbi:hypothetical protein MIND_01196700 [Mycena indigotica]|uniref:Transcription factor domain-containing protein n=1 Tax=Mycena indigotica TaxID=2126181 RepID=A0A8H6S7Z8_9AGAR|nr:uncharacterized protein MIND_01196700 [Mycena indigotica]KAF7292975.1 hypothetical protein MIND_01196700 [Mycena indigotica]